MFIMYVGVLMATMLQCLLMVRYVCIIIICLSYLGIFSCKCVYHIESIKVVFVFIIEAKSQFFHVEG